MIRVENDCVLREAVDFSADIGIELIEDVLIKVALFILLFLELDQGRDLRSWYFEWNGLFIATTAAKSTHINA